MLRPYEKAVGRSRGEAIAFGPLDSEQAHRAKLRPHGKALSSEAQQSRCLNAGSYTQLWALHKSVVKHGVGDLYEAGDVCADNEIAGAAIFLSG